MLQKGDHILGVDGVILIMEIQLALRRDGADGRKMLAGPPLPQDGRLPHRRVGAHDTGQGVKTGLVYEEEALLLLLRPLLRAGQVCSRQCAMAASSR